MSEAEEEAREEVLVAKIRTFLERWPRAEWGPGHVVLSDYNFGCETWCIGLIDAVLAKRDGHLPQGLSESEIEMMRKLDWYEDDSTEELQATRHFLVDLVVADWLARL